MEAERKGRKTIENLLSKELAPRKSQVTKNKKVIINVLFLKTFKGSD